MEVEANDATADVKAVDEPEAITEAIVVDAKIDDKNTNDVAEEILCEASFEPLPDADRPEETNTVVVDGEVKGNNESELEKVEVLCASLTNESKCVAENDDKPATENDVAFDPTPIADVAESVQVELEQIPSKHIEPDQTDSEPMESEAESAPTEAPSDTATDTVAEPPSSQNTIVDDSESDSGAIIQVGSSQSYVESERETDVTTENDENDDNDEGDISEELYKDENLLQILSSSPEPEPEPEIPSQNDKWNETAGTIDDDEDGEGMDDDMDEIEEEIEEEEEEEEEYGYDEEEAKPRTDRRMPKEDEILSLSDDDDDYTHNNDVDKKADDANYPHSEYSDEDVASISDEEDDEIFGSNDSMDYSEEDEEQRPVRRREHNSEEDLPLAKRSADRPGSANERRPTEKDRADESPAQRNSNCVNDISLRVSVAGPQLSECHDKSSRKSPNANVAEVSSLPKPDCEMQSNATQLDITESKVTVVDKGTVDEKTEQQLQGDPSTRAIKKVTNSDRTEAMEVSENDAGPNNHTDTASKTSEDDNVASPLSAPPTHSIKDGSDNKKIDSISVDTDRRSPIVNGTSLESSLPKNNVDAAEKLAINEETSEQQVRKTEKLLNGENSSGAADAIKIGNVESNELPAEKTNAKAQTEGVRREKEDRAGTAQEATVLPSEGRKRKASDTDALDDEGKPPAKNIRVDLESNIAEYDRIIRGLIDESTATNDPDNIQNDIEQLQQEIESLNEAARMKELEWNNILYLKKMKEDMLLRIVRKKTVIDIESCKLGDDIDMSKYSDGGQSNDSDVQPANNNNNLASSKTAIELAKERCKMNSSDLAKERSSINRMHRNIQGKSANASQSEDGNASAAASAASSLLTNYMATLSNVSPATILQQEFLQQRLRQDAQNQSHAKQQPQFGRQGPIKDVKSLIDDFRQQHPEAVPRRGRRMKNVSHHSNSNHSYDRHADDDTLLGRNSVDLASRSSSSDSMHNNAQTSKNFSNILAEHNSGLLTSTPLLKQSSTGGYPEVTLHPIKSSGQPIKQKNDAAELSANQSQSSSLLHGILTKTSRQQKSSVAASSASALLANVTASGYNNSFSPTLARLLTAPERNLSIGPTSAQNVFLSGQTSGGVNLTKNQLLRSQQQSQQQPEISFVPISQILAHQQQLQNNSLLQQQLQRQRDNARFNAKGNSFVNMEDETDDNDRLVIDEGIFAADESHDNELPECQGCKKREAQFVCADCQRQWYCSRECQVSAWDEHSEVCSR